MLGAATIAATLGPENGRFFHIQDLDAYAEKVATRAHSLSTPPDQSGAPRSYVLFYENATEIYVTMVWTHPGHRGQGLAESLLRKLIRQSAKDVRLEVQSANPAAGLYRKLGFTPVAVNGETATLVRRRRLAVMQPYLFPYIGYFHLIEASDAFVFYDDVNFIKSGWINRNQILLNGQAHRFTVPLAGASPNQLIKDVALSGDTRWYDAFTKTLTHAYRKAPHFPAVYDLVTAVLARPHVSIADLAIDSVCSVYQYLGWSLPARRSSETAPETRGMDRSERLIALTKRDGLASYVNAAGGTELYDRSYFSERGVELSFVRSTPSSYLQSAGHPFVSNLSIIDVLMFNSVEQTRELLSRFTIT